MIHKFTLRGEDIEQASELFVTSLAQYGYATDLQARYRLLLEEGLIFWQERLGEGAQFSFEQSESAGDYICELKSEGEEANPYEQRTQADLFTDYMDNLLSRTGQEVAYSYEDGSNKICFCLPTQDIERTIMERNVKSVTRPLLLQELIIALLASASSMMLAFIDKFQLAAFAVALIFRMFTKSIPKAFQGATVSMITQYWGVRDRNATEQIVHISLVASALGGLVLASLAYFLPQEIMRLLTDKEELVAIGALYLKALALYFCCDTVNQALISILRGTGRARKTTVIGTGMGCFEVLLTGLLVCGWWGMPRYGALGVGMATSCASFISLLIYVFYIYREEYTRPSLSKISKISASLSKKFASLLRILLVSQGAYRFFCFLCGMIVGRLSVPVLTTYALYKVLEPYGDAVAACISTGAQICVGAELGRGDYARAKEVATYLRKLVTKLIAIVALCAGAWIIYGQVEMCYDKVVTSYLTLILAIYMVRLFAQGLGYTYICGIAVAGGDVYAITVGQNFIIWLMTLPLAYVGEFIYEWPDIIVLCVIVHFTSIAQYFYTEYRYRKGYWLRSITEG